MEATEILVREHDFIIRAIKILRITNQRFDSGDDSAVDAYPALVDFIRQYADRYHHGKEEDVLFKVMENSGVPLEAGPLGAMLAEHDEGRAFVKNITDNADKFLKGDKSAKNSVVENADKYADLLEQHIEKENKILYPLADKVISDVDKQRVLEDFKEIERKHEESKRQYESMINDLEKNSL